jgi:hypothetical protein
MTTVIKKEYQGPDFSGSGVYEPATPSMLVDPSITARTETVTMTWHYERPPRTVLTEAEAPALAKIWDNDSDAIFDTM